ncbi:MAG: hypothetical protein WC342_00465 [Methanoregula sp.]|jgi:hypothetical protein
MEHSHAFIDTPAGTDAQDAAARGNEPEDNELEWMKRHDDPEPVFPHEAQKGHRVERRTALRNREISSKHKSKRAIRSRTERDLLAYDSDIPYAALEDSFRKMICAWIEQQDRVSEKFLLMINNLQYRLDDLELGKSDREKGYRPDTQEDSP